MYDYVHLIAFYLVNFGMVLEDDPISLLLFITSKEMKLE